MTMQSTLPSRTVDEPWESATIPVTNERPVQRQPYAATQGNSQALSLAENLPQIDARQLAQGLGWFSIGLGLAEVAAPQFVAESIGVVDSPDSRLVIGAMGLREIAVGLAILAQPDNPMWLQARVGGDAEDLALLGTSMRNPDNDQARLGPAIGAVAGITALDLLGSWLLGRQ